MARLPELIPAPELARDQLLTIPGVGSRNISHIEAAYEDVVLDQHTSVQDLTPEHFVETGKVSHDTAKALVDWIQRHVEDTWTQPELFDDEEDEEEIDWDEEFEINDPIFALAFDPMVVFDRAIDFADEHGDDRLAVQLSAIKQWLRGEVAPYHANGVN